MHRSPEESLHHRYWHADAVTTLGFSASCQQLASASGCELAIWSPVTKAAEKQKASHSVQCWTRSLGHEACSRSSLEVHSMLVQVRSKVTCLAWSPRGQVLALALEDGCISLHDAAGTPTGRINHDGSLAALAWRPARHIPVMAATNTWLNVQLLR